jgi:hypothetical protein
LQRNAAGALLPGTAGTGLLDPKFKTTGIAYEEIAFFHISTICHVITSSSMLGL